MSTTIARVRIPKQFPSASTQAATAAKEAAEAAQAAAVAAQGAAETAAGTATTAAGTATTQAGIATTKASEASASASSAATSATSSAASASAAGTSAANANTSAGQASTSASQASSSATNAASSASGAATSATAAAGSATSASASASNASTSASQASTSATNAASSATTATTQAGIATTKAGEAATSAGAAATSASTASTHAASALQSANNAAASQNLANEYAADAETSAGESATKAAVAEGHAVNAAASESAAAISAGVAAAFAAGNIFADQAAGEAALSDGDYFFTEDGRFWRMDGTSATEIPALSLATAAAVTELLNAIRINVVFSDGADSLLDVLLNSVAMVRVLLDAERQESGALQIGGLRFPQALIAANRWLPHDVVWRMAVRGLDEDDNDLVALDVIKESGFIRLDFEPSERVRQLLGSNSLSIPESMFDGDAGTNARSLQVAMFDDKRYVWNAVEGSLTAIPELIDAILLHLSYGESNSENGGLSSTGNVATAGDIDKHRALMFSTGYLGTQGVAVSPDTLADFVPGHEVDSSSAGESGGSSFLRKTLADTDALGLPETAMVYRTCGTSGQTIWTGGGKIGLSDPSQIPYQNFVATVARAVIVAALYGKRLVIPHYNWTQGFNEALAVSVGYYYPYLIDLIDNFQREITSRTGQRVPPWMLIDVLTASDQGGYRSGAALAQVDAFSTRRCVAPTCCSYWFNGTYGFNTGQNVHWKPVGKALLKEYTAKAGRFVREAMAQNPLARLGGYDADDTWYDADLIWRWVYNGDDDIWEFKQTPFETSPRAKPGSFQISGSTITFRVPYAEGGLSIWDDLRGPATDYGFAWSGAQTITNVTVGAGEIDILVTITFSGAPTSGQTLSYAIEETDTTADAAPAVWGDLFDNCAEPSQAVPGLTLRQGLLPFSVVVT